MQVQAQALIKPPIAVETGAGRGIGTELLLKEHEIVHSIELDPVAAYVTMLKVPECIMHVGDSAHVLPILARGINEPVYWYLDAHWCDGVPAELADRCGFPLWEELDAIRQRPYADLVYVDDYHTWAMERPEFPESRRHDWDDVHELKIIESLGKRTLVDGRVRWSRRHGDGFLLQMSGEL